MNVSGSDPARARRPPGLAALAFCLGGVLVYLALREWFDPPPTWDRCGPPSSSELAELSDRRADFLRLAVPLVVTYGILLAVCSWKWAGRRRAQQGQDRRPGRLVLAGIVVLGSVWALLLGDAFLTGRVGGAILYGFILAAAGVFLSVVLGAAVVFGRVFHSPRRSRSEEAIDALSVGLAWSMLFFGVPLLVIGLVAPGNDATLWC
jgi:hypothetical protein